MTERIVVFRSDQPHRFLSDVCAARPMSSIASTLRP